MLDEAVAELPVAGVAAVRQRLDEACAAIDRRAVSAELAALVRAIAESPGSGVLGGAARSAGVTEVPPGNPTGPAPAVRTRVWMWLLSVAVLVAVVALEVVLLRDDIVADVHLLLEAGRSGSAASTVPQPDGLPLIPPAPPAVGTVAGVDLRPLTPCTPGAPCTVRVLLRLLPAAGPQTVSWSFQLADRCTGATDISAGGSVTVPAGAQQVAAVDTVLLPAHRAVALVAVTGYRPPQPHRRFSSARVRPTRRPGDRRKGSEMAITGSAVPPPAAKRVRRRRRTWQERRNRLSAAFDLLAVVAALGLVGLGLANLAVTGAAELAARQGMIAVGGLLALTVCWGVRVRLLGILGWVAYGVSVMLLAGVLVAGVSANGATRWIGIGSFSFQPSELAKLGLLLVLAAVLGSARPEWQRFAVAALLAVLPIGLTAAQPDLSTTTLLTVLAGSMLVIGRVPVRFLLPLVAAAAVSAPLAIGLLRPYQVERLGSFLVGAHGSPTGSGWAVRQAQIAVGSGMLFGRTDDPLRLLRAQYVPERETDLALASLVGQWGLVVGASAVVVAILLVWRLALAARASRTPHGALVGGGLAILLGVETVVSVGGNLGLLPLAGRPVPAAQLRGHRPRRPSGRDRRRPGRPPRRRSQAAVGPAAPPQSAATARPRDRARAVDVAGVLRRLRVAVAERPGRGVPVGRAGADDALHLAARAQGHDHGPAW